MSPRNSSSRGVPSATIPACRHAAIDASHDASIDSNPPANALSVASPAADRAVSLYVTVVSVSPASVATQRIDTVPIRESGVSRTYSMVPAARSHRDTSQSVSSP